MTDPELSREDIEAALAEMVANGEVVPVGDGTYALHSDVTERPDGTIGFPDP